MIVEFKNIGSAKKSWTVGMSSIADQSLIRQIRKHHALVSPGIDFKWAGDTAVVYVGDWAVGKVIATGAAKAEVAPCR